MSCNTETKTIGEREYGVTQWPADRAMLMQLKIMRVIGPTFAALVEHQADEVRMISEGINSLFENASPEELVEIIKECIILNVATDGKKITDTKFTEIFSGDALMDIYKIFIFVVRVNYGNLLKGQLGKTLLAKMQGSLSTSSATPT